MQMTLRRLALLVLSAGFACQAPAQASVIDYVKIPDKEYRWELKSKTESIREDLSARVTGMFRKPEEAVDELRGKVDSAVKQALDVLGPAAKAEIERLQKRIQELEQKIEQLTKG